MKKNILLLIMSICSQSCTVEEIGFSTTNLLFNAQGGTEIITSKRSDWNIYSSVYIDCKFCDTYIDSTGTVILYTIVHNERGGIQGLDGNWFTVDKETSQKLVISTLPNETGYSRQFQIECIFIERGLEHGNYITVTQSAD